MLIGHGKKSGDLLKVLEAEDNSDRLKILRTLIGWCVFCSAHFLSIHNRAALNSIFLCGKPLLFLAFAIKALVISARAALEACVCGRWGGFLLHGGVLPCQHPFLISFIMISYYTFRRPSPLPTPPTACFSPFHPPTPTPA